VAADNGTQQRGQRQGTETAAVAADKGRQSRQWGRGGDEHLMTLETTMSVSMEVPLFSIAAIVEVKV
jgi:hypothetical protein